MGRKKFMALLNRVKDLLFAVIQISLVRIWLAPGPHSRDPEAAQNLIRRELHAARLCRTEAPALPIFLGSFSLRRPSQVRQAGHLDLPILQRPMAIQLPYVIELARRQEATLSEQARDNISRRARRLAEVELQDRRHRRRRSDAQTLLKSGCAAG